MSHEAQGEVDNGKGLDNKRDGDLRERICRKSCDVKNTRSLVSAVISDLIRWEADQGYDVDIVCWSLFKVSKNMKRISLQ
jgi:hypothetical protein